MIELKKLSKVFTTDEIETTALHEIDLSIKPGEFVAIKGPSGCGKTTLLNILGLMDTHTSGDFKLFNEEINLLSELQKNRLRKGNIGFVFQKFNLIDSLTIFENIELPLLYQKINPHERKTKIHAVMERLQISHRAKHFPCQLSGGQQQRAAVARCLVSDPKLILADEPTGNLDSSNGQEVLSMLQELNSEGKTVIMVTHDEKYASYAGRLINLFDGKIV